VLEIMASSLSPEKALIFRIVHRDNLPSGSRVALPEFSNLRPELSEHWKSGINR